MIDPPLPKIILFDFDGTLVDNMEVVVEAYYQGLRHYGFAPKSREYIASLMGKSTFETARDLGVPEDELQKIDSFFWEYFRKFASTGTPVVMNGIPELLVHAAAHGIRMGVVTSNEAASAQKLLHRVGLAKYFDVMVGSEHPVEHKPSPQPIQFALQQLRIFGTTWFVGDTKSDVLAAKAAKVIDIAVPLKHTLPGVLEAKPSYTYTTKELLDTFKRLLE